MGQGISAILGFAVGVAISPVPIIAVILMLFSERARVNGPVFLVGWVVALAVVSGVAYAVADGGDASTNTGTGGHGRVGQDRLRPAVPRARRPDSGGSDRRRVTRRRCRRGWPASTASPR